MPRFADISQKETSVAVAESEERLGALDMMSGLSVAAEAISRRVGKAWSYHLIILNSLKRTVKIKPYNRDSFEQAVRDYESLEAEAAKGAKIEPVLVSAGPLDKLRRAYPNFFLDIKDFVQIVTVIVASAKKR